MRHAATAEVTLPVAVIDTNVIVSGLIGGERASPTAVILDAMLGGRFTYLFSLDLLADYREVLLRSAIRRRHGLSDAEVEVVLTRDRPGGRCSRTPCL
jgi:predicted nucleic acid-binding protein